MPGRRPRYVKESTNCMGGINTNDASRSKNQVADARNVWAPDGKLSKRPGTYGEWCLPAIPDHTIVAAGPLPDRRAYTEIGGVFLREATGYMDLTGVFPVGSRWYLGFPQKVNRNFLFTGAAFVNANPSFVLAEYWNGSSWKALKTSIVWNRIAVDFIGGWGNFNYMSGELTPYFGGVVNQSGIHPAMASGGAVWADDTRQLTWVLPNDWEQSTLTDGVNIDTFYWLRFTLLDSAFTPATVGFSYDFWGGALSWGIAQADNKSIGFVKGNLLGRTVYINIYRQINITSAMPAHTSLSQMFIDVRSSVVGYTGENNCSVNFPLTTEWGTFVFSGFSPTKFKDFIEPITTANFPETSSLYFCLRGTIFEVGNRLDVLDLTQEVSLRDLGVRPWDLSREGQNSSSVGAPWDSEVIAQLDSLNTIDVRFITAFNGRMWLAEGDYTIRWSAAIPFQNVWPLLAVEYIVGDDSSPITGLWGLGEALVVFKRDSIWTLPYAFTDQFNITHYTPRKQVSGTGCVGQGSIQDIDGGLCFLGTDGLYLFDGVSIVSIDKDPRTSSSRLGDLFDRITSTMSGVASSVLWKTKHCYLLAVPCNGSSINNLVIVWDYKLDALWIWELAVAQFILDKDHKGKEVVYFVTHDFEIFSLSEHLYSDYGAPIISRVLTRKFGFQDDNTKCYRTVDVLGSNVSEDIGIIPTEQSESTVGKASFNLDVTDPLENFDGLYVFGTLFDKFVKRHVALNLRQTCNHLQYELIHEAKDKPFEIDEVTTTYYTES